MAVLHGINIAGLEYGYTINTQETYTYFATKGFKTVRIPFKWERLQPNVGGQLDATYLAELDEEVTMAGNAGLQVILDMHNYGRRDIVATGGFWSNFDSGSPDVLFTSDYGYTISNDVLTASQFNRVYAGSIANPSLPATSYRVTADITMTANGGADSWRAFWFEAYHTDVNNRYFATINNITDTWELFKVVSGTQTMLASGSRIFNVGQLYSLTLDINQAAAGKITLLIGNVQVAQENTDPALLNGYACLYGNGVAWECDAFELNVNGDTDSARAYSGSQVRLGDSQLNIDRYADVWRQLATHYKDNTTVIGYDLMNEMHDMPVPATASTYLTTATNTMAQQAAYDAITTVDTRHTIYVQPDHWSGAQSFLAQYGSNPQPWINDPYNIVVYSFHYYFDSDHSGSYPVGYQSLSLDNIYPDVEPVLKWAQERGVRSHIGEYGTPSDDTRWLTVLTRFLDLCTLYQTDTNYWAAGWVHLHNNHPTN